MSIRNVIVLKLTVKLKQIYAVTLQLTLSFLEQVDRYFYKMKKIEKMMKKHFQHNMKITMHILQKSDKNYFLSKFLSNFSLETLIDIQEGIYKLSSRGIFLIFQFQK